MKQPANDTQAIYLKLRYVWVGGLMVGIPVGSVLGSWSAFVWLPVGCWAMYRIWKDQQ